MQFGRDTLGGEFSLCSVGGCSVRGIGDLIYGLDFFAGNFELLVGQDAEEGVDVNGLSGSVSFGCGVGKCCYLVFFRDFVCGEKCGDSTEGCVFMEGREYFGLWWKA